MVKLRSIETGFDSPIQLFFESCNQVFTDASK